MDKRLKTRWLKALRSGEFKQCKKWLAEDGKYCCLGVLHKLATKEEPPMRWSFTAGPKGLPDALAFVNESYEGGEAIEIVLSNMNDAGKSFKQIALWIERNL